MDKAVLDAEFAACGGNEEAIEQLVLKHLEAPSYLLAKIIKESLDDVSEDAPNIELKEAFIGEVEQFRDWIVRSVATQFMSSLAKTQH